MKVKCRLLFSIIMCLCLLNIGGVFSYAGGSSGGSGSGYVSSEPVPTVPFFAVQKMWLPDNKGEFGPNKDKDVTFNLKLSFNLVYGDEILNFDIEKNAKTKKLNMPPELESEFKSTTPRLAVFRLDTGTSVSGSPQYQNLTAVTTIQDSEGLGYTAQFATNLLKMDSNTGNGMIKRVLVYKTPKTKIEPPFTPEKKPYNMDFNLDNIEQPAQNAAHYGNIPVELSISEVDKFKDYKTEVEYRAFKSSTPVPPGPPMPPMPPIDGGEVTRVPVSLNNAPNVKSEKSNADSKATKLDTQASQESKINNEATKSNDEETKGDTQTSDIDNKASKANDDSSDANVKAPNTRAKAPAAKAAAPVVDVDAPDVDVEGPDVDLNIKQPRFISPFKLAAVVNNTYNPPTPSNPPNEEEPPTPPSTTEKNPKVPPKANGKKVVRTSTTPSTGDTENLFALISIMGIAIAGTITIIRRKKA